jgi:hypothetical protein
MSNTLKMEDWLEFTPLTVAKKYEKELLELGVSDETFRHDRDTAEVVELLYQGGIPRLAATDIVHNAKRYFKKQHDLATAPLAIFWDAENVHIPQSLTGLEVVKVIRCASHFFILFSSFLTPLFSIFFALFFSFLFSLFSFLFSLIFSFLLFSFSLLPLLSSIFSPHPRSTLQPFGNISQFNVYLDVSSTATLSVSNRSQLQLSGCHVIDTPHMNRKEVADKMIIVDALLYLINCKENGATLCFITGDQDYAYLLSQLKAHTKFRTILVCQNATNTKVLESSADHVLSWHRDVLKINKGLGASREVPRDLPLLKAEPLDLSSLDDEMEEEEERIRLLLRVIREVQLTEGERVRRSAIGLKLLAQYPQKFGTKESRADAIQKAEKRGLIRLGGKSGLAYIELSEG